MDEKAQNLLQKKLEGSVNRKKGLLFAFRERRNCCGAGYCEWIAITLEDLDTCSQYEQVGSVANLPVFVDDKEEFSTYLLQEELVLTTTQNGPLEIFSLA